MFSPLIGDISTTKISFTVAEVYNKETCPFPQSTKYTFTLQVVEEEIIEENVETSSGIVVTEMIQDEEQVEEVAAVWVQPEFNEV